MHVIIDYFLDEETGKCVDSYSISIYRRWNYENNIAAIVCHVENGHETATILPRDIFVDCVNYAVQKLKQGHETDSTSVYNINIFYPLNKVLMEEDLVDYVRELSGTINLVYTFVPVTLIQNEHTYLSICGVRNQ